MIIEDQIELFKIKFGEPGSCRFTDDQIVTMLNGRRELEAIETKFYDVVDSITAAGGETYGTLRDDFIDLWPDREAVTYDDKPVIMKPLVLWNSLGYQGELGANINASRYGMKLGKTFNIYPAADAGGKIKWRGYGLPTKLGGTAGADAYLTNGEARLTVLGAVIEAKTDSGLIVPQQQYDDYKRLRKHIEKISNPQGPRLHEED